MMEGRRYVTGSPERVVQNALMDACWAECRSVGAAEHEAAGRERDGYFDAFHALVAERDRYRAALEVIIEMGDYTYKPHEFAVIARKALTP